MRQLVSKQGSLGTAGLPRQTTGSREGHETRHDATTAARNGAERTDNFWFGGKKLDRETRTSPGSARLVSGPASCVPKRGTLASRNYLSNSSRNQSPNNQKRFRPFFSGQTKKTQLAFLRRLAAVTRHTRRRRCVQIAGKWN